MDAQRDLLMERKGWKEDMFEVSKKLWCGFDDLKALFQQLVDQTMVCLQGGESLVVNIIYERESRRKTGDCPSPKG